VPESRHFFLSEGNNEKSPQLILSQEMNISFLEALLLQLPRRFTQQ
jgi:hypothetical protein